MSPQDTSRVAKVPPLMLAPGSTLHEPVLSIRAAARELIGRVVGAVLLAGSLCTGALAAPPEATTYHITADHAGVTTSGGVLALQPKPLWTRTVTGQASYPVIAGGRVFVTSGDNTASGTTLSAFDANTGATLWSPVTVGGTYPWAAATYESGKLFVLNTNGLLQSVDAATGTAGWSLQLPGQYMFSGAPNATNGVVFASGAGSGGTAYAVDESTGAVIWTASVMNGDQNSPAVFGNNVYLSFPCQVYDLNATTGMTIWHDNGPCEGGGGKTPVAAGGRVYVRDPITSNMVFDGAAGTILDTFSATPIPAVTATTAFYLTGSTLSAVDLATDAVKWTFAGDNQLVSAPIVVDQTVIEASISGQLYGLDVATGVLQWQASAGANISAPDEQNVSQPPTGLAVADGVLVVAAGSHVVAFSIFGPPAPIGLVATGLPGTVHLTWSAAMGAASYNVYIGSSAGAETLAPVQSAVVGTSADVTGLTVGTPVFFTVKAVTTAGISAPSNEASATPTAPTPPSGLQATAGNGSVQLAWTAAAGTTSYSVYQGTTAGGEGATAVLTGISGTAATVSSLMNGTQYYFVVRADTPAGLSGASNEASATPVAPSSGATGGSTGGGGGAMDLWSLLGIAGVVAMRRRKVLCVRSRHCVAW